MKVIGFKATAGQVVAIARLKAFTGANNDSELFRALMSEKCAQPDIDIDWPDDMDQHGGNRIKTCDNCGGFKFNISQEGMEYCYDCGLSVGSDNTG